MNVYECFRILELPRDAGLDDLKSAYRKKAKIYHPDRKGGDNRMFNRLHEAYSFLLEYGTLKGSRPVEEVKRKTEEAAVRAAEAARRAEEIRRKREAEIRTEQWKKKREADAEAARKADERRRKEEKKTCSPSHAAHEAGEILRGRKSEREKLEALGVLVSLKRKSVYPYMKLAFYGQSERVIIAAIEGVGKLKIAQAVPELSSLICSGSPAIRLAVMNAVGSFPSPLPFRGLLEIAAADKNPLIRKKAADFLGVLHG